MISAEIIKSRVSLESLIDRLGIEPNRAGYISCPAHLDKTPSLKLYDSFRGWYCFGCNKGGSVIDFYMHYTGKDFKGAVSELSALYGLDDYKPSRSERVQAARARGKVKKSKSCFEKADEWYQEWLRCKQILEKDHKDWNHELEDACQKIAYAEYVYQELTKKGG